jgi:3-oxoacyl-(acyl-carrier-protein) synthase
MRRRAARASWPRWPVTAPTATAPRDAAQVADHGAGDALALESAGIPASEIGYVNAHGTATDHGDIAESAATLAVLGDRVPISSLKSYMGHTLGACGALEAWMTIEMMREGWFAPNLNLERSTPLRAARLHARRAAASCRPNG